MRWRAMGLTVLLGVPQALVLAQSGVAPSSGIRADESRAERSRVQATREAQLEEQRARSFGLQPEEWARYRELMRGPLGVYSPNLDPLTALGIEARTTAERQHIAELQVRMEARRAEKTLAYQRAYDEAWRRLYPGLQPVREATTDASQSQEMRASAGAEGRLAVFVKENCPPCDARVKQLQAAGRGFDLYMVGSQHDDARIRRWAASVGIDPSKVRAGKITLNHDGGRWLSIDGRGSLPAVVRTVNGQWQRE